MNEAGFKAKLRKFIKPHCYIQSIGSPAVAGLPDLWLSGKKDLFIEVKFDSTTKGPIKPKLSALQTLWLNGRLAENRNVCVICGTSPKEGIFYKCGAWNSHSNDRISFEEIISRILREVL